MNRKAENQEVANEQTLRQAAPNHRTANFEEEGRLLLLHYLTSLISSRRLRRRLIEICHETQTPQAHHSTGVQSLPIAIGLKDKG